MKKNKLVFNKNKTYVFIGALFLILPLLVSAQPNDAGVLPPKEDTSTDVPLILDYLNTGATSNQTTKAPSLELQNFFNSITNNKTQNNLSQNDQSYLNFREGESAADYIKKIQIENARRSLTGQPLLPDPTQSTTQNPPNNGIIRPPLDGPAPIIDRGNKTQQPAPLKLFNDIGLTGLFEGKPLTILLNQIFYFGLLIAVILAIVMIVRGGIQYMTTDAIDSKSGAKKRIQAALGGLVLAFSSILILNTINPSLTNLNIELEPLSISGTSGYGVDAVINGSVSQYGGITPEQYAQMAQTGQIPDGLSPTAQKILAEALNSVGNLKTGAIPGTDGGNKACAAALNKIISSATGQPINTSLSTRDMSASLASSDRFVSIPGGLANSMPGDIIISPTSGSSVGHVGIIAKQGGTSIISNSSKYAEVRANHTGSSWTNYYQNQKGLPVMIYRSK